MNEQQESVIRKIQKLLALGQSPNEAEATLAMARAQELLAKNNLEYAMVTETAVPGGTVAQPDEKRERTRMSRSAQYRWQRELWKAIAEANFCWHSVIEVFEGKRGKGRTSKVPVKRHMILGRESNVIAVRMMGEYLEDTMERLLTSVGGFENRERLGRAAISWKAGCAERLAWRIAEQAEERKAKSAQDQGNSNALVLHDVYQREYQANYDARLGAGSYARRLAADAEWEAGQAEREAQAEAARQKAEREWLEYLQNETPQQKKVREREEAKARIKEERAYARQRRSWRNQEYRESAKVDHEAYRAGRKAGDNISLDSQISSNRKDRSLT